MGDDASADSFLVFDEANKLVAFVFFNLPAGFIAADLLIECIKELLSGGCSGVSGAVLESAAESAETQQSFGGSVERNPHSVEEENDGGCALGHPHNGGLMVEKVAAGDGVFEVKEWAIAFTPKIDGTVDATLSADAVTSLDGDDRKELDFVARFSELHCGHEASETPSNDDNSSFCSHSAFCK